MAIKHPDEIAASGSEDAIQRALLQALALWVIPSYPSAITIYHIPNGGSRGSTRVEAQLAGAMMQAMGQKKGIPDLCLPVPQLGYGALYIEMKKPKSGRLSADQRRRITELTSYGNFVAVCDTWMQGYSVILDWYSLNRGHFDSKYAIFDIGAGLRIFDPSGYWL